MRKDKSHLQAFTAKLMRNTSVRGMPATNVGAALYFARDGPFPRQREGFCQSGALRFFRISAKPGSRHFEEGVKGMYQGNCAGCEQKVRSDENYLKAHLWASTAVFHWSCFVTLMKERGETATEDATWKASRVTRG